MNKENLRECQKTSLFLGRQKQFSDEHLSESFSEVRQNNLKFVEKFDWLRYLFVRYNVTLHNVY